MTMFLEPLQRNEGDALSSQLLTLYDAYCEFNCYCAFIHQAHAGIVARDVEIEQAVIDGISMSGRCLMLRSLEIKQQLKEVLVLAQKEAKNQS